MKQTVLIFSIVLIFFIPFQAAGQERKNYLSIKSGLYTFTGGLREANFATGFDGEIVYGRYLTPNCAVEIGTGYFHDGVYNWVFANDIKGIPVMLTVKVIYPLHQIELFAGGGGAVYFTEHQGFLVDADAAKHFSDGDVHDTAPHRKATVFGGHFVAGVNYSFSPAFFFGIEGKYIITQAANFEIFHPTLNGYTVTGSFGYRF